MLFEIGSEHITKDKKFFWAFLGLFLLSSVASILLYNPLPLLLPIAVLLGVYTITDTKNLYYLFFALLPFSIEIHGNGLGTDLPSEPIMIILSAITLLLLIINLKSLDRKILTHPISLTVVLHLTWILLTGIYSTNILFSIKFFLAKLWYILPFYFLPLIIFSSEKSIREIFKYLSIALFIAVTYVLLRHASEGFTFESSNRVMRPIFRNHVNYAIMLAAFLPYFYYLIVANNKYRIWVWCGLAYLLVAIFFSYTRAAQAVVLLIPIYYFIIRWRLTLPAIIGSLCAMTVLVMFLFAQNNYLDYAPDFDKTITHKNFDNLLEATTKLEDISTMERVYRWVAGARMVGERPLLGFGPSTFYSNYETYTVHSFRTYVSDNPEKSGMHNNYLMVAAEQGVPGLVIMLLLVCVPLLYVEKLYHRLESLPLKRLVCAAGTCLLIVDVTILINELLETDKVGSLYFLSISILVWVDIYAKRRNE